MSVLHEITDHNQPDNVVDFTERRELDGIKGELSPLCVTLRITPSTLLMAAQIVANALHAGAEQAEAYAAGVRYARAHQEPVPETPELIAQYANLRTLLAKRRPLTVEGELAAVEAEFGGDEWPRPAA